MSDTTFYYIIGGLAAILAVLLFNSYKEKRYRDEVRRQFGHSDQDALLADLAAFSPEYILAPAPNTAAPAIAPPLILFSCNVNKVKRLFFP